MKRPVLLIVRGIPGSGKSTLTDQLLKLPSLKDSLRLDPDLVDQNGDEFVKFCQSLPLELPIQKQIYRFLLRKAEAALKEQRSVIWEQPWRTLKGLRITLGNLAFFLTGNADISAAPFQTVIVEINISPQKARKRVASRFQRGEHRLRPETFDQNEWTLEPCDYLGLTVIPVDGTIPPEENRRIIKRAILKTRAKSNVAHLPR